jgi:hypothetical protein
MAIRNMTGFASGRAPHRPERRLFLRDPFRLRSRCFYGLPCSAWLVARSLWLSLLGQE